MSVWAQEGLGLLTTDELSKKLNYLSLLPHFVERNGKDVPLTPGVMDPGIYDGPEKYKIKINEKLQDCLKNVMVMENKKFRHIKVALVDLTKGFDRPEFAASFDHRQQVYVASIAKIAPMLAVHQLLQDLQFATKQKGAKTIKALFELVHKDWADTQLEGKTTPFTAGISLRGKLVLVRGEKIKLGEPNEPKAPQLDRIFANVPAGTPVKIEFRSTGENFGQLKTIIDDFNLKKEINELQQARQELAAAKTTPLRKMVERKLAEAKQKLKEAKQKKQPLAKQKLEGLGFLERMGIMVGGSVPASNYATSTIFRDVGYLYIASTLLQSGLYDTNRKGGLWFRDPRGRIAQPWSATAGSLAAFMTLLVQERLVSPIASKRMGLLMQKVPDLTYPGTGSWFKKSLEELKNRGSLKRVLAKVGRYKGADDFAYIEREVDDGKGGKKTLHYVAVGLRAKRSSELEQLILELDKCILANNDLTSVQGGHPPPRSNPLIQ